MFYGKLGVVRVLTSQWGFTRPFSIYFSLSIVRDIDPPIIEGIVLSGDEWGSDVLRFPHIWGWRCSYDCSYFFPHLSLNVLIIKIMSIFRFSLQECLSTNLQVAWTTVAVQIVTFSTRAMFSPFTLFVLLVWNIFQERGQFTHCNSSPLNERQ